MHLISKRALLAILFVAISAFGEESYLTSDQTLEQKPEMMPAQMGEIYNAYARIRVRSSWDAYTVGSFTYWQPIQENMELAIVTNSSNAIDFINGSVVNMDFDYKPGFKIGLGLDFFHDKWTGYAEYTWFRGSQHVSKNVNTNAANPTIELDPLWGAPNNNLYVIGSENWQLDMDFVDAEFARCFHVGTRLSFQPFFGARGAWIRQRVHVNYQVPISSIEENIREKAQSWGIGPRTGLHSNWILGQGFRLFGNSACDLLYTRYLHLSYQEHETTANTTTIRGAVHQKDLDYLRTHLELELGIGWGSCFYRKRWHIDLSAGYGFQVFFHQNMFRHLCTNSADSTFVPDGNLYMQGLTATAQLNF